MAAITTLTKYSKKEDVIQMATSTQTIKHLQIYNDIFNSEKTSR